MMTQAKLNFCHKFGMLMLINLLVTGCASLELANGNWADIEEQSPAPADSTSPLEEDSHHIEQTQSNLVSGEEFELSALDKPSPQKEELLLYAVSAYIDEQNLLKAQQILTQTNQSQLPAALYLRQQALYAALYIRQNEYGKAEQILDNLHDQNTEDEVFNDWLQLAQTQLDIQSGNFLDSLTLLSQIVTTANGPTRSNQNQAVWLFVRQQSLEQLEQARFDTADKHLLGWIELGIIDKKRTQIAPGLWQQSLGLWRSAYSEHPASTIHEQLTAAKPTVNLDQSEFNTTSQIALLLPLSSSYGEIARTIRDGFLAASSAQGAQISVYDTGADLENVIPRYQKAILDGAQIIVGPLGKAASNHLAGANEIVKPTVLLGSVTSLTDGLELSPYTFMYSLDPEHEAQSIARQAFERGYSRAAVLYPDSSRGKRLNNAFAQAWRQLGASVITSIVYPNELYEAHSTVNRLFDSVTVMPDIVFLASNSQQGRLLSQVISKRREDLAIYATSSIYSGQPEPTRDFVLDNVIFSDMPWMIEGFSRVQYKKQQLTKTNKSANNDSLSRYFAFGVDAYTLASKLPQFMDQPGASISGVTGNIQLTGRRFTLSRPLIQFTEGVPTPIN